MYRTTDDIEIKEKELKDKGVTFVKDINLTEWQTREFAVLDIQEYTIYYGQVQ